MASLLDKAKQIRDQLKAKAEFDAIPKAEKEQIISELNKAVSSNKLVIKDDTFQFTPTQSDVKLPALLNITVFILIVGFSVLFFLYFNQAETNITSQKEKVEAVESRLIQAIKEESELKISEKEREIEGINQRLENMHLEQQKILSDYQEQSMLRETELRKALESNLKDERDNLEKLGYSDSEVEERLRLFEEEKQIEFQNELDTINRQLESERAEKEETLNKLISENTESLEKYNSERLQLENELNQQLSENEELIRERNSSAEELERLGAIREKETLIINQIFTKYSAINNLINNKQYSNALVSLNELESFIQQDDNKTLPAISFRKETDLFMIQSLRKLIESENTIVEPESTEPNESELVLAQVANMVEEGNKFYEQGDLEAARESYLTAISQIPSLNLGFSKLKDMEDTAEEEKRDRFVQTIDDGDRLYQSNEFESAVRKYREALEYLEKDSDIVDKLISQLMDARLARETSEGNKLITSEELALLNQAVIQKEEKEEFLKKLDSIEDSLTQNTGELVSEEQKEEQLLTLLNTKLLLKEILTSEPIKEEYSDLYDNMEIYLEAYGKEKEKEGRDATLAEIVKLTEQLSSTDADGLSVFPLLSDQEKEQRELFLQFLRNLKDIIEFDN